MDSNFKWTTRAEKLLVIEYWWKEQAGLCCICGQDMEPYKRQNGNHNPLSATIEHLIPKRDNGPNTVGNVRLAHAKCNHVLGGLWSINQDRTKHGLPLLNEKWALESLARKRKNGWKRRPAYRAPEPKEPKPIRGTLAHAVMTGEVSEDLMYRRPNPMDIKLKPAARKMTAIETARWLAQQGIR